MPRLGPAGALVIEGLHKSFGELEVLRGIDLVGRPARGRLRHRLVGRRQVDAPALHQPPRADRRGPDRRRRRRDHRQGRRRQPDPAADRDRVPGVQPVPAHDRHRQRDARAAQGPRPVARGCRGAGDGAARPHRPGREARRLPRPAVGRPAAARRDRPGAGDAAGPDAARRDHERPRSGAGRGGPRPDPRARDVRA